MSSTNRTKALLKRIVDEVLRELDANPEFASRLEDAMRQKLSSDEPKKSHRRAPGVVDPFAAFAQSGEEGLRASIALLTLEQLKDIVAQHGMDRTKLAMKWKTADRLADLIVETVTARSRKGDAFR
jgi:hypothetical protein